MPDEKRQKVRARLRHLHALQAEKMRQDENERQIADALTQRGKHRRRDLEAQALIELVDERGVRHKRHDRADIQQRQPPDGNDLIVRAEPADDRLCERSNDSGGKDADHSTELCCKNKRLPCALAVAPRRSYSPRRAGSPARCRL